MLRTEKSTASGFSLVELMLVVAIIGIGASLAMPAFKTFQKRAWRAETSLNFKYIRALLEGYIAENGGTPPDNSGSASGGNIMNHHFLVQTTSSSNPATSCNHANDIGFKVGDCRKVRYTYAVRSHANPATGGAASDLAWTVLAHSMADKFCPWGPMYNHDILMMAHDGRQCVVIDGVNNDCTPYAYNDCSALENW